MAAVSEVVLVGLRLGGALAYEVSAGTAGISRLVLWDPVIRGTMYLEALAAMQAQHLRLLTVHQAPLPGETEWLGWLYPAALRTEIGRIDLLTAPPPAAVGPVHMVLSSHDPEYDRLHDHLAAHGTVTAHHLSESGRWADVRAFGSAVLGSEAVETIVHIVEGGA